ncbi:lamin tail domain-containing protein [Verrucomicrobiales bacterium]|jgi:hypothetical protein|nr:lamin tail domain-containing protein [Verrucomicrobiales bacterium]
MAQRGAYMSNRFVDDSMLEMGSIAPHGRFVHVYLNGVYWGQYHLRERWNAAMFASYFGGSEEDYDTINGNDNFLDDFKAYDGTLDYWRETEALSREGTPWQALQGRVDLTDYYDFMILWATGNSESEFQSVGSRSRDVPFKFYMKDADGWLRAPSISRLDMVGPGRFSDVLRREANPDYVQFLADRIHKHYRNGGALTDAANIARLQRRVDEMNTAFLAEAARWNYHTLGSWRINRDDLLNHHFDGLAETMVTRFTIRGFYPHDIIAPRYSQPGGQIIAGTFIRLTAGALFNPQPGNILYTTNGVDPRMLGGARSSDAIVFDRSSPGISLSTTTQLKARTFDQGNWSLLTEATFYIGKQPSPGDVLISEIHCRPASPADREIAAGFNARSDCEFLEIYNTTDELVELSGLVFTKGIRFDFNDSSQAQLEPGKVALLVRNRLAFAQRYGGGLPIVGEFTNSKLSDGGETIQLALSNGTVLQELTYDENEPWPKEADGSGKSLSLSAITPRRWSGSASLGGTPGEFSTFNHDADQDGDRLSALVEAALGTSDQDPTSGPAAFRLTTETREVEGLEVRFWRFVTQKDPTREDLTLHLEVSSDLRTWQSGDTMFVLEEQGDNQFVWRSKLRLDQLENALSYLRLRVRDS